MTHGNWDLPQNVREIADVIGRDDALFLTGHYIKWDQKRPGRARSGCVYIPKRLKPGHRLVELVGQEKAEALVRAFGGEILQLGCCSGILQRFRMAEVRRMAANDMSHAEIAEIIGISRRHVRKLATA